MKRLYDDRADWVNEAARVRKAKLILSVLHDYLGQERVRDARCLDVGCATGVITAYLSAHVKSIVGADVDREMLKLARLRTPANGASYVLMASGRLPVSPAGLDIVVLNHVYNYVPDKQELFRQIHESLVPGGICYFAGVNGLTFPKRSRHETGQCSYGHMKRLIGGFALADYTHRILAEPRRFRADIRTGVVPLLGTLTRPFWRLMLPLYPSWVWILRKV